LDERPEFMVVALIRHMNHAPRGQSNLIARPACLRTKVSAYGKHSGERFGFVLPKHNFQFRLHRFARISCPQPVHYLHNFPNVSVAQL
jgi:hypothetical protein